jgi:hypothetical protein
MGEKKKKKEEEEEIRKKNLMLGCRIILCIFFLLGEVSNCYWGGKNPSLYAKTEFKLFPFSNTQWRPGTLNAYFVNTISVLPPQIPFIVVQFHFNLYPDYYICYKNSHSHGQVHITIIRSSRFSGSGPS